MLRTTKHKRSFEMTKQTGDADPVVETYRKDETLHILTAALAWLRTKEDRVFRTFFYRASW